MKPLFRKVISRRLENATVRLVRQNPNLQIIAVGGSIGKTSTKMAIATVLKQQFRVMVQEGNYNSPLGLPLSLFELEAPHRVTNVIAWLRILSAVETKLKAPYPYDIAVLELGTDHPGDIAAFMRYLKPDYGVVTAIAPEHMENFATLEAVADEEFTLAAGSKHAVLNADFAELVVRGKTLDKVKYYGGSDAIAPSDAPHLLGRPSLLAASAAVALGGLLGMSDKRLEAGVSMVQAVPGRMQRLAGINGAELLDDTYNAAPDSVISALDTLRHIAKKRRIAVLGQMNELGEFSHEAHEVVGTAAADLDLLVTVGKDANDVLGPRAVAAGLHPDKWHASPSPYEAGNWLKEQLKQGDTVLFKGSQNGVFTEESLKMVLKNPDDARKLVRQSSGWLARKHAQFPDGKA